MKLNWAVAAASLAALAATTADPALARTKHKMYSQCDARAPTFTWGGIVTNPAPQPNGCSPPVFAYGRFVGQDPDQFIRSQLARDPQTGYFQY
jgi:hypothetical protein